MTAISSTPMSFSSFVRRAASTGAAALLAFAAACSNDGTTSVFDPNAPARLSLDADVRFQTTTGAASLRVRPSYLRADRSTVALDSQTVALTDAATQQVPISIDLTRCLNDAARAGANGAAPAVDECVVRLALTLITNGQAVANATTADISLRPGVTASAPTPVTLDEVGRVELTPPPANVVSAGAPLRLEATRTLTIASAVFDGANRALTRTITWTSANTSVATVSAGGVVTGVAPGTTRITAAVGTRSASLDVRVVPLPQPVTVSAATGSTGAGTVVSAPAGINCTITGTAVSGTCSGTFPSDAPVSLTMTPASGATFSGWGGDCSGTTTCTVTPSQPRTVTAALQSFRTLTVSAAGTGNGTISAPGGVINCVWRFGSASSGPCTAQLPDGAQITLTATPDVNNQFSGWSGDCSAATGTTCTLTMSANRSAVAQFRAVTVYRITAGSGTGAGVVTSNPSGMNCTVTTTTASGTCTLTVPAGTNVSLIATPGSGSAFGAWSGACANQGATCASTAPNLPGELASAVRFDRTATLTLAAVARSTGSGRVNGTNLFFCQVEGSTTTFPCRQSYPLGTTVTLTAGGVGYTDFVQWGGACGTSFSSQCTLTLNADASATIQFEAVPTARLTTTLNGLNYQLVLRHPYQGQQACGRTVTNISAPATVCSLTVPVGRSFTLSFDLPTNEPWVSYYMQGVCANWEPSSIPCSATVTGDDLTIVDARPLTFAIRAPAMVKSSVRTASPDSSTRARRPRGR